MNRRRDADRVVHVVLGQAALEEGLQFDQRKETEELRIEDRERIALDRAIRSIFGKYAGRTSLTRALVAERGAELNAVMEVLPSRAEISRRKNRSSQ